MKQVVKSFFTRQFVLFLAVGGSAALVNFWSRVLYSRWLEFPAAVMVAYCTGMVTAFTLNRRFVFKGSKHSMRRSAVYFCLVNLVAVVQTWGVSMLLAYYLLPYLKVTWHVQELAHAAGVAVPVFTSFIGHRHFTFRKH
jgi:putative flippase GtrA